ncbi:hypothetical protein ACFWAY_36160 [Rhodococcus sp. NPDC059968]|uniref:hypothetical protein n=1 Tax=Rhodococcus sp. NPDC059968 TaxID=3347017 RepID=UPI00366C911D
MTLDLLRIAVYPSGIAVHLTLTATGHPAERARHEARPLTDPADPSAHRSYLNVWVGTDGLAVADPYFHRADLQESTAGHACTGPSRRTGSPHRRRDGGWH